MISVVGIDLTRRQPGEVILVETTEGIYEIILDDPKLALALVTGTDLRLRQPTLCQIRQSSFGNKVFPNWIGLGLRMQFTFRNCVHETTVALSASVSGAGWWYEVFSGRNPV